MAERQGCSVIVVVLVSAFAFVVGALAGAGGLYVVVRNDPSSVGIEPEVKVVKQTITTTPQPVARQMPDYGLLYPIEETLRIQGKLPAESVTSTVKDKRYSLRECYQKGLEKDPTLKGEISIQFTVSGDTGKVIAALERNTDIGNKAVKDCIVKNIKSWQLKPTKAGDSVVRFDMLLIPLTSAPTE